MSVLARVRNELMKSGASEAEVLAEREGIQGLFGQIQDLKREMNDAKKKAAAEAAKPYEEAIASIERKYALMMKLSARDTRK